MRLFRTIAVAAALVAVQAGPVLAAETTISAPNANPADPGILDAARGRVAAGDTRGAIDALAPYVASHPQDAAAGRLLGDLYFRVPDYPKAERIWKAILSLEPNDRETHGRLGSLYAVQDRIADAMAEFQLSLPSRAGYAGLVMIHKKAGDLPQYLMRLQQEAHDAFAHVVTIRPSSCAARVDIANVLVDLGRIDPAIVHLKTCLGVDANFYPAVVNLGEAYLEKNDAVTARPYLDRALQIRPEGTEALVDIGYIYDMHGDWKTAVTYYNRAIRSDPLRPEAYIDLGYDYNEHRLFPLAEAAYIKGLAVSQDDGRLHYMLAVTYNLQGKIALARDQYRHAIASEEPIVVRAAQAELALLPPAK
jgi:tetratricopeptide (TPR) repeat protein